MKSVSTAFILVLLNPNIADFGLKCLDYVWGASLAARR